MGIQEHGVNVGLRKQVDEPAIEGSTSAAVIEKSQFTAPFARVAVGEHQTKLFAKRSMVLAEDEFL